MKSSRRARRIQRHYSRMHRAGGLNLVSLMDIFTILVFFLMVNSSDVKVMQQASDVSLPLSTAETPGEEALLIEVSGDSIRVQGREVARLEALGAEEDRIAGLFNELQHQKQRRDAVPQEGLEITVMADQGTAYRNLRRIMQTCVDADYRRVRLAVEHDAVESGAANG
ncbi:biopolymer transporter ExbD [Marinobacter sp. R17]|uniref:ExbD/TolR family protein n=1 Tax=Marinobacter sp. R17 TaxID=2484250 RepID=UPI000F4CC3A5|nr:biopolymer transporter ExbD [Marinobacter sp. R17]ROT98427.1 biopolymer transporter ExbD [Marinobacter sp. R17]